DAYNDSGWTRETFIHVAFTYDGTTLRAFQNGVEIANHAHSGSLDINPGALYLGDTDTLGQDTWNGLLSDVRLWNIVRDTATITAQKDMRLTGGESGLVGYWPLNDGRGRVATSLIGSPGKDGASQNCDIWAPVTPF